MNQNARLRIVGETLALFLLRFDLAQRGLAVPRPTTQAVNEALLEWDMLVAQLDDQENTR